MHVRGRRLAALAYVLTAGLAWPAAAAAQLPPPDPPGPYVVDLRGATSGLPSAPAFYPPVADPIAIASRGLGGEAGAHVYLLDLGPARVGVGASVAYVRGTAPAASSAAQVVAPQLSFNFGTADGWSYLSAGVGTGRVKTEIRDGATRTGGTGTVRAVNVGGGARWFLTSHIGVGFDVRFHRLAAGGEGEGTPRVTLVTVAVGLSLK